MDDHYYSKDGKQYERVTRILDYFSNPELVAWKVKVGQKEAGKVSRIALKCGKAVDEMIRASRIPKLKDSDEIKSCLKAWKSWKENFTPKNIVFPQTLFCEKRMLAGTPDFTWADGYELSDIKTSNAVRESYFFQLGAYASMLNPMPKRLSIIRFDKQSRNY